MRQYRKHNWPALLTEYEQSGLKQTEFCKEKDINPKYFSQKYNAAKCQREKPFVQVEVQSLSPAELTLEVGRCKVICPHSMPLQSLATLIHTLA